MSIYTAQIVGGNILGKDGKLKEGKYDETAFIVLSTPYGVFKLSVQNTCDNNSGMDVDLLKQPAAPEVTPDSEEYWHLFCQGLVGIPNIAQQEDPIRSPIADRFC